MRKRQQGGDSRDSHPSNIRNLQNIRNYVPKNNANLLETEAKLAGENRKLENRVIALEFELEAQKEMVRIVRDERNRVRGRTLVMVKNTLTKCSKPENVNLYLKCNGSAFVPNTFESSILIDHTKYLISLLDEPV